MEEGGGHSGRHHTGESADLAGQTSLTDSQNTSENTSESDNIDNTIGSKDISTIGDGVLDVTTEAEHSGDVTGPSTDNPGETHSPTGVSHEVNRDTPSGPPETESRGHRGELTSHIPSEAQTSCSPDDTLDKTDVREETEDTPVTSASRSSSTSPTTGPDVFPDTNLPQTRPTHGTNGPPSSQNQPGTTGDSTGEASPDKADETTPSQVSSGEDSEQQSDSVGDVVVVTGGSGFLGQHIVKMLQKRAPHVAEIRVLDVHRFEQKLEYPAKKRLRSIVGSVSDSRTVTSALTGAHSVFHVAGKISWGTFPDMDGMEETNVAGTVNVFNACIKNNVRRLVYCSTVDVAVGFQPILGGDEEDTPVPPPDGFMFPGYPETKYQGERVVLNAARVRRQDGEKLQTAILRANVLYGELDTSYVINGLRSAKQSRGTLRQIGDGMAMFQQTYAGNTAWAFVRADQAMRENPELTGEAFYIPDHTPVQNSFNFMRPYLEARGYRLSEDRLSYAWIHSAVKTAEMVARGIAPLYKLNLPVQSHSVQYVNTSIYFSGEKARKMLGYQPIYTPNEARQACLDYYKTVDLD